MDPAPSPILVALHRRTPGEAPTTWRLVALPPSGGGATFYQPWTSADPTCDLISVRYPGRESRFREPFAPSLAALADEVADALAPVLAADALPTALLGHSMGGALAAEVAARVERQHPGRLGLLVISAKDVPDRKTRPSPLADGPQTHEQAPQPGVLRRLFGRPRQPATTTEPERDTEPEAADDIEAIVATDASLRAWMRRIGGTPSELLDDPDFMAMQLPILRADLVMSHRHTSVPAPMSIPLLLIASAEDSVATAGAMREWSKIGTAGVRETTIPGGHHALVASTSEVPALVRDALLES